jgi:acyl carrier protein
MGLDGVELILEVEDQFGVEIPEDAPPLKTVGEMHAFIIRQLEEKGRLAHADRRKCLSSATFHLFRRALVDEYGLNPKGIRPSSSLEALVPADDRRRHWESVGKRVGFTLPWLVRPSWMVWGIAAISVSIAAAGIAMPALTKETTDVSWAFIFGAVVFAIAAAFATSPFATRFGSARAKVRGMTMAMLPAAMHVVGEAPSPEATPNVTAEDVWDVLRQIVAEQLDVKLEKVTKDARFVEDLGVG